MTDILTLAQEQLYHDMHAVHEAMAAGYQFMTKEALAAAFAAKVDAETIAPSSEPLELPAPSGDSDNHG